MKRSFLFVTILMTSTLSFAQWNRNAELLQTPYRNVPQFTMQVGGHFVVDGLTDMSEQTGTLKARGSNTLIQLEYDYPDKLHYWSFEFEAAKGQTLHAGGEYLNATRFPFNSDALDKHRENGMDLNITGFGCNQGKADFRIDDLEVDPQTKEIKRLDINFTYLCDGFSNQVTVGAIRINSRAAATVFKPFEGRYSVVSSNDPGCKLMSWAQLQVYSRENDIGWEFAYDSMVYSGASGAYTTESKFERADFKGNSDSALLRSYDKKIGDIDIIGVKQRNDGFFELKRKTRESKTCTYIARKEG